MISISPNYKCPCGGRLRPTSLPNRFECQRCGQAICESAKKARVTRGPDGTVRGVSLYLSQGDLKALGIDPTTVDVVKYRIVDESIRLDESKTGDDA